MSDSTTQGDLRCSFCQKKQRDVRKLIAGRAVNICDECVEVCVDMISERPRVSDIPVFEGRMTDVSPPMPSAATFVICALCRMPSPLEDGLLISNRGVLCAGCIAEVEIAIATRNSAE